MIFRSPILASVVIVGVSLRLLIGLGAPAALADSYQVNASVAYPAPTQPAQWDSSITDGTVQQSLVHLFGTCQQQNPSTSVSIWNNGGLLGSTLCNGSFDIQIVLQPDFNALIARTQNASLLYGPDSSPLHLTFTAPKNTPPKLPTSAPSSAVDITAVPKDLVVSSNDGALSGLRAVPTQSMSVLSPTNNTVSITVHIEGGSSPYSIHLNWGDGSEESRTVQQPGDYLFNHAYEKSGDYQVRGDAQDVLGASTRFEYAVVAYRANHSGSEGTGGNDTKPAQTSFFSRQAVPSAIAISGILIAGGGYWLGWHRGIRRINVRKMPRLPRRKA